MRQLDILSYGISMTTLEEVFLEVNGSSNGNKNDQLLKGTKFDNSIQHEEDGPTVGKSSCWK